MVFWVLAGLISVVTAAVLVLAAKRARGRDAPSGNDLQIYRDQLDEVERDRTRQMIDDGEAERLRLEVSLRLLDADRQAQTGETAPAMRRGINPLAGGLLVLAILGGTFWLYDRLGVRDYADMPIQARLLDAQDTRANRPEQAVIEARVEPVALSPDVDPKFLELMDRLRAAMLVRVDDLQGFELLARNEAALGNFAAAHRAQKRVIEIKGADADAADYASYGDMLVLAADGYVSPAAEAALSMALEMDGENGTARYYIGLMFAQTGRPDLAFNLWNSLLQESSPEAPWVPPIRRQIEFAAADAGIRYQLPDADSGPSAADIAAVQDLSPEDQNVLIRSMVTRLSDRLAREGGEPLDWARLISALGVLGDTERAAAIWAEAQTVFAASPDAMETVRAAAVRAGLAN